MEPMVKKSDDYFADIELIGDAIGLLIGDRKEDFALERPVRLFQLKCWLIDRSKTIHSFNRSKKIFASLSISVEERARRLSHLTPSESSHCCSRPNSMALLTMRLKMEISLGCPE